MSLVLICMADSMCLISVRDGGDEDKKGITKLISCATSRGDGYFRAKVQDMDDGGRENRKV